MIRRHGTHVQAQTHATQVRPLQQGTFDAHTPYTPDRCGRQAPIQEARYPQGTTGAGTVGPRPYHQWRTSATSGAQKAGCPTQHEGQRGQPPRAPDQARHSNQPPALGEDWAAQTYTHASTHAHTPAVWHTHMHPTSHANTGLTTPSIVQAT
jgi:hypothetical protein